MKLYPLVFAFRDIIIGNGYVASVAMDGQALLVEEDDGDTWVHGVQPGGVAGGDAKERNLALNAFKTSYLSALFDIAAEVTSFDQFKARTQAFFGAINESILEDWIKARHDVLKSSTTLDGLVTVNADANPPRLDVNELAPAKATSNMNEFAQQFSKAA